MSIREQLKVSIIRRALEKKKKETPFDGVAYDLFQLPEDAGPLINNSYYFGGNSLEGESLVMRIGFRNTGKVELFVLYRTVDGRFFEVEKQEYDTADCPLKVTCEIPEKQWRLQFDGHMIEQATNELFNCSFDVAYKARLPIYDFMYHADFIGMARAFAREKWNREFFGKAMSSDTGMGKSGKKIEQHHYEQTGRIEGVLTLWGHEPRTISLAGARDHSFGKRDWNYMDDHIWLLAVTGKGEVFNFSIVNYPYVKRIFVGYTDINSDRNHCIKDYHITSYDHNNGMGPDVMTFDAVYADGTVYHVKATRRDNVKTPFDGGNFYFQEGLGDFEINGIPARGSIEYGFNKDSSRWFPYE